MTPRLRAAASKGAIIGHQHLRPRAALFVVDAGQIDVFRTLYDAHLSDREKLVEFSLSRYDGRQIMLDHLRSGNDLLIAVEVQGRIRLDRLMQAFHLARSADAMFYPVGCLAAPLRPLTLRSVAVIEPPFAVPTQQVEVDETWLNILVKQVALATEQAEQLLVRWREEGTLPTS
ncbi:MAG: hypothetical protein GYB68_18785 [Chloroflexi bacterium]|nr:hypothetical protein [Chloroflexota bacterium]